MTCTNSSKCNKCLVIKNNKSSCCDNSSQKQSSSEKRIISSINSAIDYKDSQKETILTLKDIAANIISVIQNSLECGQMEFDCYKDEALNAVEQYNRISVRTCDGKKCRY